MAEFTTIFFFVLAIYMSFAGAYIIIFGKEKKPEPKLKIKCEHQCENCGNHLRIDLNKKPKYPWPTSSHFCAYCWLFKREDCEWIKFQKEIKFYKKIK